MSFIMKLRHYANTFNSVSHFAAAIALLVLLTGCKEANLAIDFMLGTRSPSFLASHAMSPLSGILLRKRTTEERLHLIAEAGPNDSGERQYPRQPPVGQREKKESQADSPHNKPVNQPIATVGRDTLSFPRDPFRPPEEGRPTECPPSMPLCRFDRSELRLRGLIRVGDGQFKGMVEDPDGRGYFITPGMQISGATVTQVTSRGITLFMHKSKKIDWMFIEGRDTKEN
jgi:hypothetical protein